MGAVAQAGPGGRYGAAPNRRGVRRRLLVAVLGAAVAAATGYVSYLTFRTVTHPDVAGTLIGFEVLDDSTMGIEFTVTRDDPARPAVCIVRARSRDGSETGRREVLIAPSPAATVQVLTQVRTSKPPGVGDVYGCGYDVPGYLVPQP